MTPVLTLFLLTGLSLSVGWGIRGNFGHEYGAMLPGALATLGGALLIQRPDWWKRAVFFAAFGGIGWSFGGSISYMQVIGYTHSGDSLSVAYGFASLFVIGFLWGAMGGAGAGLAARLKGDQITSLTRALIVVFLAWLVQDYVVDATGADDGAFRQASPLYWYDTDWLAALMAPGAVLVLAAVRRRWDEGCSLIANAAVGWWLGFGVLVLALGWRMTPPRGDSWAGCLGMVIAVCVWFQRKGLPEITGATLLAGFVGGIGFSGATLAKLIEVKTGWNTNWHSVLEQSYGFINGLGVAATLWWLARRCPLAEDDPPAAGWCKTAAAFYTVLGITYLNLVKNVADWAKVGAVPNTMYGVSSWAWFNTAFLILGLMFLALFWAARRKPAPDWLPASPRGAAMILYLVLLWWMVSGNFERALVKFAPQRLVTEGVIIVNAVCCTMLLLLGRPLPGPWRDCALKGAWSWLGKYLAVGVAGMAVVVGIEWATTRAVWGDQFAGHASLHIRFGPKATASKAKPAPNKPHP